MGEPPRRQERQEDHAEGASKWSRDTQELIELFNEAPQQTIRLSAADYDAFLSRLEEPPRDLPELRALFNTPSILEREDGPNR